MSRAIAAARDGMMNRDGGPFGAVVVKDGQVEGISSNKVFATCDPTAHAEIMAIRNASKALGTPELKGCDIYTVGEPCPMCLAAIYWSCISRIFYANSKEQAAQVGFDDSFIYRELKADIQERCVPMKHTPATDAIELFLMWEQQEGKGDLPQT